MDVAKFLVGVLTIAIGLWAAGRLGPALIEMAKITADSNLDHNKFKLGKWDKILNH